MSIPTTINQNNQQTTTRTGNMAFTAKQKPADTRLSNIQAAKAIADVVRTSLGPRGMDKMIVTEKGQTIVTNDGATIMKHLKALHPCARMLVGLSEAQDVEAGDGTTSVVVLAGALLSGAETLLGQGGLHPTAIADGYRLASAEAIKTLRAMSSGISLSDKPAMVKAAMTSLNSKVVAPYAQQIAGIAVEAVLSVKPLNSLNVDLKDIKVISKVGGTVDEMAIIPNHGIVLNQPIIPGGPTRLEKAKVAFIQFQLSPPKTDMESSIVVTDYQQMDRILREERAYILNLIKRIKKTGCSVLLVQKSILRDSVSEMAVHYLNKSKIMVIDKIERDEADWLCRSLGCRPIADIDSFTEDKMATVELVEERALEGTTSRLTVIEPSRKSATCCVLVRGANQVILDEAERSLHDCLCAVKCLVKEPAVIVGGGAGEVHASVALSRLANELGSGANSRCLDAFADALLAIPTILAENSGLSAIDLVTELRGRHVSESQSTGPYLGVNVRRGGCGDMREEGVLQPLHVSTSAIQLATEAVCMILKIDDIVASR